MSHDEFDDISLPSPPSGGLFDPTLRPNGAEPRADHATVRPQSPGHARRQDHRQAPSAPAPFEPPSSFDAPAALSDTANAPGTAMLRVPPHSVEAEASVLGGLLLDNNPGTGWAIYCAPTTSTATSTG